jgi:hypothetical protein
MTKTTVTLEAEYGALTVGEVAEFVRHLLDQTPAEACELRPLLGERGSQRDPDVFLRGLVVTYGGDQ